MIGETFAYTDSQEKNQQKKQNKQSANIYELTVASPNTQSWVQRYDRTLEDNEKITRKLYIPQTGIDSLVTALRIPVDGPTTFNEIHCLIVQEPLVP
jgi:hypothetical protein